MTTPVKIGYPIMPSLTEGVISPATEVPEHIFYFYTFFCIFAYYVPLLKEVKFIFIREMDHLVYCVSNLA